jgi:hyperosmotically inducible protein
MNFKTIKLTALFAVLALSSSLATAGVVEDTAITAAVKASLVLEKDIPATAINVTTKDNVVTLKGDIDTRLQADRAIEIAASMDNVDDVIDALKVKDSKQAVSDALLTAKVKGKIRHLAVNKKIADGYDLHVETINNVVHIFGEVADEKDLDVIMPEVKKIKSITNVKINVRTKN